MHHTVHAAQINKRAVGGERLHHTGVALTDFRLRPERGFLLLALVTRNRADRTDRTAAALVDFDDAEARLRTLQRAEVFHTGRRRLRCGNEHAHAVGDGQHAALDHIGDDAFEDLAALGSRDDRLPALLRIHALLGQRDRAFLIVGTHNQQFQLIADLDNILGVDIGIRRQFVHRHIAGLLAADNFDLHFVGSDPDDDTAHFSIHI